MATTSLTVNVKQVEAFAKGLEEVSGEALGNRVVLALNDVVDRAYDLSRSRVNAGINLTDDYVRRKMTVEKATPRNPVASITAPGSENVPLRNYDAKVITVPGRTKSRSNDRIGIPRGQRQRAVQVEVTRGQPLSLTYGFMLPLKRGALAGGNGLGVFTRDKEGKLRHRYGPSVYQLFKFQIDKTDLTAEIGDDLETTLVEYAQNELLKAIT